MNAPVWLYRHFAADGSLLYIGVTYALDYRFKQHAAVASWAEKVAFTSSTPYATRQEALDAERVAIAAEKPLFNVKLQAVVPCAPIVNWRTALAAAIKDSGKSKRRISLEAGFSPGYVHSIFSEGKEPGVDAFLLICSAIGCDPAAIIRAPLSQTGAA